MLAPSPATGGFTSELTDSRCFVFMGLSSLSFGQPLSLTLGYRHTDYFCSRSCQVKPQSGKHFLLRNADSLEDIPTYALDPNDVFTSSPRATPGPAWGRPASSLAGRQPFGLDVGQAWLFELWLFP